MARTYTHPYDLETARWIREHLIMDSDEKRRQKFLDELENLFTTRYAEMLRYISNDYRVFLRDDQLWPDFQSTDWVGAVWSCGRAFLLGVRKTSLTAGTSLRLKNRL